MYMEISTAPGFDPWPCCAERGEEPVAWDVDGNRYLDCCMCCAVDCRGI
jgi:acetylornithine/succinyldiaminopimelate/putrescine aminotransferase